MNSSHIKGAAGYMINASRMTGGMSRLRFPIGMTLKKVFAASVYGQGHAINQYYMSQVNPGVICGLNVDYCRSI